MTSKFCVEGGVLEGGRPKKKGWRGATLGRFAEIPDNYFVDWLLATCSVS